jgi:hypothetical protein
MQASEPAINWSEDREGSCMQLCFVDLAQRVGVERQNRSWFRLAAGSAALRFLSGEPAILNRHDPPPQSRGGEAFLPGVPRQSPASPEHHFMLKSHAGRTMLEESSAAAEKSHALM